MDSQQTVEPISGTLYKFSVSLREEHEREFPIRFECDAEDYEHAAEQAENAYPGCVVLSTSLL